MRNVVADLESNFFEVCKYCCSPVHAAAVLDTCQVCHCMQVSIKMALLCCRYNKPLQNLHEP